MHLYFKTFYLLLISSVIFSLSCSPRYLKKIERGNDYSNKPGYPAFSLITTSRVDDDNQTSIRAYISLVESSLIYKNIDGVLKSNAEVILEINKKKRGDVSHRKKVIPIELYKDEKNAYYDQKNYMIEEGINVDPGNYEVNVTIIDHHSAKQQTASRSLTVPDPSKKETFHSNILLMRKRPADTDYIAINNYDVQAGYDSLLFEYQIIHSQEEPVQVRSILKKFRSDSSLPRRMSDRNYRSSSLEYLGVDYTSSEIIQSSRRTIHSTGNITIQVRFNDLPLGNYRFESITKTAEGRETFRARDFSIKSTNYPSISNTRELAQPLAYLMDGKDYRNLMAHDSPEDLRKAIDHFWLSNIRDKSRAKVALELYYERVEQANLQFSNFKPGWKTDPGMIYILFGPPNYVEKGFGEMTWFYSFDAGRARPHISFKNVQYGNTLFPFDHYLLNRSDDLFSLEYQQIQAWLSGSIEYLLQQ